MLVTTAEFGDVIEIDATIKIYVLHVRPSGKVTLGIDAPKSLPILRENAKNKEPKR